ncbi:alpha/beta hydrolase [Nonomuraea sp. NPDC048916]|uniref:alpha/beta hydrolase n=1 Tax=Nonomuraea sp. NPDC048916 TaxID=3154232 RepID=UPI0033D88088
MITQVALALALAFPPVSPVLPAAAPGDVERSPCPVAVPDHTVCGFLVVPERRDSPGRTIRVGYAVRTSTAANRAPDPVVFMNGGPGASSIGLTGFLSRMFPDRDVVTVEQRGGRHSRPSLGCPETAEAILGLLREPATGGAAGTGVVVEAGPGGRVDGRAGVVAAAVACRERLREQGVDLRGYTTREIAADVIRLREALGHPSWNLFGVGYSTRVMLDVAAADPGGVRSVVLDSFQPEGVARYDDAHRDLAGALARLGLRDRFEAMVRRLNARPARVTVTDPLLGTDFTARLTGDDTAALLAEALRKPGGAAVVAVLVGALASGHDELLSPPADALAEGLMARELGLYHAVRCQDEVPFNTFDASSRFFTVKADKAVCDAWKLPASAPANSTTDAPVLAVGGRFDPATPARTSRPAAERLPHGRFVEFAGAGHAVFLAEACAREHIRAFVADPARRLSPCPPEHVTAPSRPGDVRVSAAPYQVAAAPWLAAPFALFALASLAQLLAGALRGRALTAYAGLTGVAFTWLITQEMYGAAGAGQATLAVGVPAMAGPYTWVAVGSAVLALAAFARRRGWGQAVAALIGAGFLVWWFAWFL